MTTTDITPRHGGALAIDQDQQEWTQQQVATLRQIGLQDASPGDLAVFLHQCQRTGLDPFARQIYMIGRWSREGTKYTIQTGIDGFRLVAARVAERTGQPVGYEDTLWCDQAGRWTDVWLAPEPPAAAKATVTRGGARISAVALFREYAQTKKDGALTQMWAEKGALMIAKCFDAETEVLTSNGFEKFGEVTGQVMQVTKNGIEPCNAQPFWQPYTGPMVTLESDDLNFSVTPNHDMVTTAGKVEAGQMFDQARSRARHHIPRSVQGSREEAPISDELLTLAAAYICDGHDAGRLFKIGVSRPYKVAELDGLNLHSNRSNHMPSASDAGVRVITPTMERTTFTYNHMLISDMVSEGKLINIGAVLALSRRQARVFVDALIRFDGSEDRKSGVRRFYTSRLDHLHAFEVAAVAAGYAVNKPASRTSDISARPNYYLTLSDRDEIPVVRWGRPYKGKGGNAVGRTGLEIVQSDGQGVWCVTVPSGEIIVRRRGFSMRCGNCAEALALRKAFPQDLSGIYTSDEMGQADNRQPQPARPQSERPMTAQQIMQQHDQQQPDSHEAVNLLWRRVCEAHPGIDQASRMAWISGEIGRDITRLRDLTEDDITVVGAALAALDTAVDAEIVDETTGEVEIR